MTWVNQPPMPDGLRWESFTHEELGCLKGCALVHGYSVIESRKRWAKWQQEHTLKTLPMKVVEPIGVGGDQ